MVVASRIATPPCCGWRPSLGVVAFGDFERCVLLLLPNDVKDLLSAAKPPLRGQPFSSLIVLTFANELPKVLPEVAVLGANALTRVLPEVAVLTFANVLGSVLLELPVLT